MEDRAKLRVTAKAKAIRVEPGIGGFLETEGFASLSLLLQIIEIILKGKISINEVAEARFLQGRS